MDAPIETACPDGRSAGYREGRNGGRRGSVELWRARISKCPLHCVVGEAGLEPAHPFGHRNLNPARLPIPPLAHESAAEAYPSTLL